MASTSGVGVAAAPWMNSLAPLSMRLTASSALTARSFQLGSRRMVSPRLRLAPQPAAQLGERQSVPDVRLLQPSTARHPEAVAQVAELALLAGVRGNGHRHQVQPLQRFGREVEPAVGEDVHLDP